MNRPSRLALITGAAGFLGRHAALAFARAGWRVVGIGNGALSTANQAALGLTHWSECPVESATVGALIRAHGAPDVVLHAAGGASVRDAADNPVRDFDRTVGSTTELLAALKQWAPGTHLLFTSSAAVYGNEHAHPIPESAAPAPISSYGLHKRRAEEACLQAAGQDGLQVTIVRYFSLYGSGLRKQIFWDLWQKILQGGRITLSGTGNETRDFLHVCDAARLLLHLTERPPGDTPLIVNGGTGQATTIHDAATLLERLCHCQAEIVFDGICRTGDPIHLVAAVDRLQQTGYRTTISFDHGLAEYAGWASEATSSEARTAESLIVSRFIGAH